MQKSGLRIFSLQTVSLGSYLVTTNGVMIGENSTAVGSVYINDGSWSSDLNTYVGVNGTGQVSIASGSASTSASRSASRSAS